MTLLVSTLDKFTEAKRELATRERLYGRWIREGKIDAGTAHHRTEVMRAIVQDYYKQLADEAPQLDLRPASAKAGA